MNILNLKVTGGPNYRSVKRHRLVVMQLDIGELETRPTNEIKGFYQRIKKIFPGLYDTSGLVFERIWSKSMAVPVQ